MPLDRHAQRLLRMIALSAVEGAGSLAERRRGLEDLQAMAEDEPDPATAGRDLRLDGADGPLAARLYSPDPKDDSAGVLIYFHGGGWVAGDLETHDGLCRRLAAASGAKVLALDYRRAPEHPFPAAIEDGLAAARWAAAHAGDLGLDPARLGLAGDSAGGGIAAAVAGLLRDAGGPPIALQLLICPILDLAHESASRLAFADGYFLDRATMAADLADYLPAGVDPSDPRLSPLLAKRLEGLPPTLIHAAQFDPFHDEALAYGERLNQAGVPARFTSHPGMIHYFYALPRAIPYAREAATMIGAQVREALA